MSRPNDTTLGYILGVGVCAIIAGLVAHQRITEELKSLRYSVSSLERRVSASTPAEDIPPVRVKVVTD